MSKALDAIRKIKEDEAAARTREAELLGRYHDGVAAGVEMAEAAVKAAGGGKSGNEDFARGIEMLCAEFGVSLRTRSRAETEAGIVKGAARLIREAAAREASSASPEDLGASPDDPAPDPEEESFAEFGGDDGFVPVEYM